jgi:hypothetical protein
LAALQPDVPKVREAGKPGSGLFDVLFPNEEEIGKWGKIVIRHRPTLFEALHRKREKHKKLHEMDR